MNTVCRAVGFRGRTSDFRGECRHRKVTTRDRIALIVAIGLQQ